MWILNLLPDSLMYIAVMLVLLAGIVGYILGTFGNLFPMIRPYSSLIKTISTILMVCGVYLYGGYAVEMEWRDRADQLQAEIDKKDAVSVQVTEKIVTRYVDRVKIIKEKGNVIIKEVPKYITEKSDAECIIPQSYVVLHDSASNNEIPVTTGGIDDTPSGLKLSTTLETVVGNYNLYYETAEQLKALQNWVKEQEKIYNAQ